jgi:hypothetical protein
MSKVELPKGQGQITAWFLSMDTDSNGKVKIDELNRCELLCVLPKTLSMWDFFTLADAKKDGKVSMVEHMEAHKKL